MYAITTSVFLFAPIISHARPGRPKTTRPPAPPCKLPTRANGLIHIVSPYYPGIFMARYFCDSPDRCMSVILILNRLSRTSVAMILTVPVGGDESTGPMPSAVLCSIPSDSGEIRAKSIQQAPAALPLVRGINQPIVGVLLRVCQEAQKGEVRG